MLYLTRKVGDSVIIDDNIEVTVVEVRGKTVKLGFTFPENIQVLRRELYDRIQDENRSATASVDLARIFNSRDDDADTTPASDKPARKADVKRGDSSKNTSEDQ
ncbi:carbon storage regulator CsrA [Thalassospira marina]|uniref:Translational regulator CsrA n=1 Tax=Thalassospira marina TaxID=2048283 RepID=A0A2N3KZJ2_9PROT|nr:carbon storage regulator CsrA [Thalassospira marina]AUG52024.1 carbon storage regulator [Thalassospira marina]PKR55953.1 carbon storage regulator [Thalassospira marina]